MDYPKQYRNPTLKMSQVNQRENEMKHIRNCLILPLLLLLTIALTGCSQEVSRVNNEEIGKFRESPCPFDLPEGLVLGENFKFGYVTVPEFHNNPNGKTIEVAVAVFPSISDNPLPDPLVLNTGGPGESNMDNFIPPLAVTHSGRLGELVLSKRDAVVIELRGLRYARPNLISHELSKARFDMLDKNLSYDEMLEAQINALRETRDRFEKQGINVAAFNNVETAADIAMVMEGLGYDQFNMFGSSAGTLLAQHVIRDNPDKVRCAILNAALPIGPSFTRDMIPEATQSLKTLIGKCENDPVCSKAYPDLESEFFNLMDSLNKNPVTVSVEVPEKDENLDYVLNGYRFASMILLDMYFNPKTHLTIDQIRTGDYNFVNMVVGFQSQMRTFADILGYSVFISETPAYTSSDIQIDPAYAIFAKGSTCMGLGGEYLLEVNKVFNIPKLDRDIIVPQESCDVPLLVLNGLYDPVIPVKYDEYLKNRFTNSYIYRFDGIAHSPVDFAEECAIGMMFDFLNDPSRAPEDSCVDQDHYKPRTED